MPAGSGRRRSWSRTTCCRDRRRRSPEAVGQISVATSGSLVGLQASRLQPRKLEAMRFTMAQPLFLDAATPPTASLGSIVVTAALGLFAVYLLLPRVRKF